MACAARLAPPSAALRRRRMVPPSRRPGADEPAGCENSSWPCVWPQLRRADGLCGECLSADVPRCAAGQAWPDPAQQRCVCLKCEAGWLGEACDVPDSALPPPPAAPPSPPWRPRAAARVPNWQKWAWLDYASDTAPCEAADPHACFGNGHCGADGVCLCDVGWRGAYCSQLDLLPANRTAPGLPMDGAMPTWGGTADFDAAAPLVETGLHPA